MLAALSSDRRSGTLAQCGPAAHIGIRRCWVLAAAGSPLLFASNLGAVVMSPPCADPSLAPPLPSQAPDPPQPAP
ncbi:unnamed protein product [Lampetra fluviatilis]